jgi:hypothetical protein
MYHKCMGMFIFTVHAYFLFFREKKQELVHTVYAYVIHFVY